ncbi:MAG: AmmeMemoRadiSam system protein A [Candidatus Marinimicrobia bacterium]|nr:AmmeMemoRadiSam system protein A [Candidatus Neomarinimicrobiota bacterium]
MSKITKDMFSNYLHHPDEISEQEKQFLLKSARRSITCAVDNRSFLLSDVPIELSNLKLHAATFVTLEMNNELRGCVGKLEPDQSILDDVIGNAKSAAMKDSRFNPVSALEVDEITIKISVLSSPQDMRVDSEAQLIKELVPYRDGLVISEGYRKSTFLPSVWENLSDPVEFIQHLKEKAGFSKHYWSKRLRIQKYFTVEFGE